MKTAISPDDVVDMLDAAMADSILDIVDDRDSFSCSSLTASAHLDELPSRRSYKDLRASWSRASLNSLLGELDAMPDVHAHKATPQTEGLPGLLSELNNDLSCRCSELSILCFNSDYEREQHDHLDHNRATEVISTVDKHRHSTELLQHCIPPPQSRKIGKKWSEQSVYLGDSSPVLKRQRGENAAINPDSLKLPHALQSLQIAGTATTTSTSTSTSTTPTTANSSSSTTSSNNRWTTHEDALLTAAVARFGWHDWIRVAATVGSRSNTQCADRWYNSVRPGLVKGHWSNAEDAALLRLVGCIGRSWGKIAARIPGRTNKQVRERYSKYLDPAVNRGAFGAEEDAALLRLQRRKGNRWAAIARELGTQRTPETVKQRWKALRRH